MAAFAELDWRRFDVWATVVVEGVAVVEAPHREICLAWLRRHEYAVSSINFADGVGPAVVALGGACHWAEKFGYELECDSRSLDALRDGFDFDLRPGHGHVLELLHAEVAHGEDPSWFRGLLSIAREYSRCQLALGARFFATLVLASNSPLIGVPYETLSLPVPFWTGTGPGEPFATR